VRRLAMTIISSKEYRLPITILLIAAVITAGIVAGSGCSNTRPIEISTPETIIPEGITQIYIGGAVNNPGFYPLKAGDSPEALIKAAGGTTDSADLGQLKLHIPQEGEDETPQKIDLNRADAWLLEALPGIGEVKAQAIINYRDQNGPFRNINELLNVKGIGEALYDEIKELVTVAD
jgi:competence protein ComEA